jgi:hypothetical protein
MPRRFLLFVLAALLLLPAVAPAQQAQPPAETKPAKKPDAFKYFFGKKDKKDSKDEKDKKEEAEAPAPAPEAPAKAPAPMTAPTPTPAAQPAAPPETPKPAPPAPRVDAFQYFFGRSAAAPAAGDAAKKSETGDKKPVDAFDFFFGKNGRAGAAGEPAEKPEKPEPEKPPGSLS